MILNGQECTKVLLMARVQANAMKSVVQKDGARNMPRTGKKLNGYQKRFKYNICTGDYGVPGECLEWCRNNCKGNWGWWFHTSKEWFTSWDPRNNIAYLSFSNKKDATRFWLANLRVIEESKEHN
jgi:hypothetical protein